MDLFTPDINPQDNLLPKDGIVNYYGRLMPHAAADDYLAYLLEHIDWKNDEAVIFGKRIVTNRKAAWYGDREFQYTYSNTTKTALPWTKELLELKRIAEAASGETFNSCLLNLYHNGDEGMAWHSDAEKDLVKNGAIGSMSFGATRKFRLSIRSQKRLYQCF
jgi:alkylated DNA repair dioxygenase AlkB